MLHNLRIVLKELIAEWSFTGVPFLPQLPDLEIKVCSQCYTGNQYLEPRSEFNVSGFKFSIQTTPFFL